MRTQTIITALLLAACTPDFEGYDPGDEGTNSGQTSEGESGDDIEPGDDDSGEDGGGSGGTVMPDAGQPDTCDWANGGDTGLEGCPCFDNVTCHEGLACNTRTDTCVVCEGGLTGTEGCPCFEPGICAHEPLVCDVDAWTCEG